MTTGLETSPADGPVWDPLDPQFRDDPYPAMHRLRSRFPIFRHPVAGWLLTRYQDCEFVLRSPQFGVEREETLLQLREWLGEGMAFQYLSRRMNRYDPPDHTRLRGLATKVFTPRRIEALRPYIEQLTTELLSAVDGEMFDFIQAVAHPLPSLVICEMLGIPEQDRTAFDRWSNTTQAVLAPGRPAPDVLAAADAAAAEEWAAIEALVSERRHRPGDDLLSALIAAEEGGDRLALEELIATVMILFSAGHQTTRDTLGSGLLALLAHQDELRILVENPSAAPACATECLRFCPPILFAARRPHTPMAVGEVVVEAGELVSPVIAAANRDPARFREPDRFWISRPENHPLAFGGGLHHCLGAALARVEVEIVLAALARRYRDLSLASDTVTWRPTVTFRGPEAVWVAAKR